MSLVLITFILDLVSWSSALIVASSSLPLCTSGISVDISARFFGSAGRKAGGVLSLLAKFMLLLLDGYNEGCIEIPDKTLVYGLSSTGLRWVVGWYSESEVGKRELFLREGRLGKGGEGEGYLKNMGVDSKSKKRD